MLSYGAVTDSWDEYLWMFESTCGDAMIMFATAMVEVFGPHYLIEPIVADTADNLRSKRVALHALEMEELLEGFMRAISRSC